MAYPGFPVYPAPMPLAGAQQAHIQPGGGIGQRLRQFTGNNQAMLMALGAGLLGNRENATANPLSTAVLGAMQGGQLDQQRREREEAEAEAEAQKNSTVEWLTKYRGMSPEEALATVQSGMVTQAIQQPAESKWLDVDGRLARLDPGAQQPEWFEPPNSGGLFPGNKGIDAQALRELVLRGILTEQQALEVAAGKTVSGPNGEMIFASPQALAGIGGGMVQGGQSQSSPPGDGMHQLTPAKPPAGYRYEDPSNPQSPLSAIPGGPATEIPGEQGARIAAAQVAEQAMGEDADENAKADVDEILSGQAWTAGGFFNWTLGRGDYGRAQRAVGLAVESALRAMTGAAAPDSEVARYLDTFMPQPWESGETIAQKLGLLRNFIEKAREMAMRGRGEIGSPDPTAPASGGYRILQVE